MSSLPQDRGAMWISNLYEHTRLAHPLLEEVVTSEKGER